MIEQTPSTPPIIAPVIDDYNRPLWSVMIPAYNCGRYLKQTLESVLVQDPGPEKMQIEVVDDASTDIDVGKMVTDISKGRIGIYRNQQNAGSLRTFETCINRSRGRWVHILHGDDFVEKGFYHEVEKLFTKFPQAGAVYTGFDQVDESGNFLRSNDPVLTEPGLINNWLFTIAQSQKIQPPSIVVKRSVYEHLGSFFAVHYGEDWEMWIRIAAHYAVAHNPSSLARYRVHENNISSQYFMSGQNILDINKVINIIQDYIPQDQKEELKNHALKNWSHYFARTSDLTYGKLKNPRQALKQSQMAFAMHKNRISLFYLLKTFIKIAMHKH